MSLESGGTTLVMSSSAGNAYKDKQASFWKKNAKNVPGSIRPVYGAQHPPLHEKPHSQQSTPKHQSGRRGRDSFQDFQDNTEDAWDDGDDDLIQMANFKMSLKDVKSTAMQVINNHSKQQGGRERVRVGSDSSDPRPSERHNASPLQAEAGLAQATNSAPNSAHSTPTHSRSQNAANPGGPGLGIRLNTEWKPPKMSAIRLAYMPVPDRESLKADKFKAVLDSPDIDLDELRKLSWSGVPKQYRPMSWKILCGYLPPSTDRRELTLQRKRQEYFNFIDQYYATRHQEIHADTFRQISIDIPRMSPLIPLFQQEVVQEIFERILYIWAIRHPASGYVQGINDLVTPFFVVFLSEYVANDVAIDNFEVGGLPQDQLRVIEADSFWCFSKLLDSIQDNYTFAQPGIQLKVNALKDIISRVDHVLHQHLETQHVEYLQFSFRWMNNLLMREIPLKCTIRLWDSYLSEASDFASLHLYTCASLLLKFSQDLMREKDFQGIMLLLQNLPTHHWGNEEINMILAEAFKLKYTFADAPKHLQQKT